MLDFLKRRLSSDKGAMDKILVTLLFVVIAIGAIAGLSGWFGGHVDDMKETAGNNISQAYDKNTTE